jgi:hypothetical protein
VPYTRRLLLLPPSDEQLIRQKYSGRSQRLRPENKNCFHSHLSQQGRIHKPKKTWPK